MEFTVPCLVLHQDKMIDMRTVSESTREFDIDNGLTNVLDVGQGKTLHIICMSMSAKFAL
jgi:hypothetical protein